MSDTTAIIIAVIGSVATLGGGLITAVVQLRRSRAAGVQERHVQETEQELARDVHDFEVLREGLTFLRGEVDRLRASRTEDRAEIDQLRTDRDHDRETHADDMREMRAKHAEVVEENRHFRGVILAVMEQLRRIPPPAHSEIYKYIIQAVPGLGRTDS